MLDVSPAGTSPMTPQKTKNTDRNTSSSVEATLFRRKHPWGAPVLDVSPAGTSVDAAENEKNTDHDMSSSVEATTIPPQTLKQNSVLNVSSAGIPPMTPQKCLRYIGLILRVQRIFRARRCDT